MQQRRPGAVEDADPRPRVGLRLRRRHRHRRVLRLRTAPQDRHHGAAGCSTRCAASATCCGSRPRERSGAHVCYRHGHRRSGGRRSDCRPDAAADQAHRRGARAGRRSRSRVISFAGDLLPAATSLAGGQPRPPPAAARPTLRVAHTGHRQTTTAAERRRHAGQWLAVGRAASSRSSATSGPQVDRRARHQRIIPGRSSRLSRAWRPASRASTGHRGPSRATAAGG